MSTDKIKMRVINRYRGTESEQFEGNAVPEGAILYVSHERARQLIANGNAVPIVGPAETKDLSSGKKPLGGTDGSAVPPSSLPADPVSPTKTARPRRSASKRTAGK